MDGVGGTEDFGVPPDIERFVVQFAFRDKKIKRNANIHDGTDEHIFIGQLNQPSQEDVVLTGRVLFHAKYYLQGIDAQPYISCFLGTNP